MCFLFSSTKIVLDTGDFGKSSVYLLGIYLVLNINVGSRGRCCPGLLQTIFFPFFQMNREYILYCVTDTYLIHCSSEGTKFSSLREFVFTSNSLGTWKI